MDKSWIYHLKSKCLYFSAEPEMLMAEAEKKKDEADIGPQIARLRYADLKIKECEKMAKSANAFVLEASKKLSQVIATKLAKAVKDNETIYLEKVPDHSAIPAISEAAMVKSVPPQNLSKASSDVFVGLVPDSSAKVVSKYTEMVDSLIKVEKNKLNASTEQARSKLKELDLPDLLLSLEPTSRLLDTILSETLREKIAEVNSFGGVSHCFELAKELQGLRNTGTQMVNSAEQELDAEAAEDTSERDKFKDKWLIPASATLTNVLRESINEFRTKIEAARTSDKSTIQQLEQPENPILCLESDKLLGQIPYLKKPMVSIGAADADTVISGLKEALVRLENCASERSCLEDQLSEAKFKDNILPQLMSSSDSEENIFRAQLDKYKPLQVSVSESVKSQDELISNLCKKHADFVSVFNIGEWKAECDAFSARIQNAYEMYKQIQSNFERGIRFYTSLQDAIGQLKQQCGDFCLTRKMQRDDFLRQLAYSQAQQQQHAQQQQQ
jgi:programmed cell death 6-interacting protein